MSRERPWSKFWWEDYENDASLKLCSLAAQGLWMRMLCFMHQSSDVGHLVLNGRNISVGDLAELVGKQEREVTKLVDELEARRVFSRDSSGRIYNRRMVKDEKARRKAEAFGRQGGNPTLKPNGGGGNNGGHNPPDKGGVNPPDNDGLNLQEAEAESTTTLTTNVTIPPRPPRQRGGARGRGKNGGVDEGKPRNGFVASTVDDIEATKVVHPFPIERAGRA